MTSIRRFSSILALCALGGVFMLQGCQTGTAPGAEQLRNTAVLAEGDGDALWPYWPASMRIHPLTRVLDDPRSDELVVETRIEFIDQHGSTTRGVGQLRMELVETAAGAGGTLLEEWEVDLRDAGTNATRFDDITRTYLFRLRIDQANFSRTAELRAYFLSVDNARLTASYAVGR